jgi:hypothetical protein
MRRIAAAVVFAAALVAPFTTPAVARPDPLRAPDFCQHFDDTGAIITIAWTLEGCYADRYAFALKIVNRKNKPGFYPPLTCVVDGRWFDWDAPACAHARNAYLHGAIRPRYFGTPPRPARSASPAPPAPSPTSS